MKEIKGNIWDYHPEHCIVIPTNLSLNKKGNAIMGKGLALDAAKRFSTLPCKYGKWLQDFQKENYIQGVRSFQYSIENLYLLPTKYNWRDKSDLELIIKGVKQLVSLLDALPVIGSVYLPRLGCGLGGLDWEEVKSAIEPLLDNRFIIVEKEV